MNEFPGYGPAHEQLMRRYSRSLPEDHRRRYAAVEAEKIGYGGVAYVARVLGMSRATVHSGLRELEEFDSDHPQRPSGDPQRVRRPGAGRPPRLETDPGAEETFKEVMEAHSAGSPTDERVRWSDLNPGRLAQELLERGIAISRNTAAAWLEQAGFRPRALRKELVTGVVDPQERDTQFRYIAELRRQAYQQDIPVFSVDTKKKELLGALHRRGTCYSSEEQYVYDHDFRHLADGVLVPHGVYDCARNLAFMTLGTSRETSAFVCDAIALAWLTCFQTLYPSAREALLLFDCGGANAARSLRFKEDLIDLSARLGLRLRIAHYPPYTSKWNPIEHRLFSQIERRWRGVILDTPQKALSTLEQTRTKTGLHVVGQILDQCYEIGRTCSETFRSIKDNFIRHDTVLGGWNYVVDANGFDAYSCLANY
ncbi:ISAzo13 family transposase [Thiorhodovibrio litoralis]|uniref:ISAzo13 family transposase n=1 Tax=Thiorhodovibrio litoralis TaxID=2952932 RepID=UPI002B25F609|nr:ISAzo13 family transposase [Thiorhodovibrio litoralis]WPL14132.1 Rhodopirellula transposase [Thiorhodovibrio litoralis]